MLPEYSGLLWCYRWTMSAKGAFQTLMFKMETERMFLPRAQFCFQGTRWEENGAENTNALTLAEMVIASPSHLYLCYCPDNCGVVWE